MSGRYRRGLNGPVPDQKDQMDHGIDPSITVMKGTLICHRAFPFLFCAITGIATSNCNFAELDCRDEDPHCSIPAMTTAMLSPASAHAEPAIYFYATAGTFLGNPGSRAVTTTLCGSERSTNYSSLNCTNDLAFLSYTGDELTNASTTYSIPTNLPVLAPNGTVIDTNWPALFDGNINVNLGAAGVTTSSYWTGTFANGTVNSNCMDWANATGGQNGLIGLSSSAANNWIQGGNPTCDSPAIVLLCACW